MTAERRQARSSSPPTALAAAGRSVPGSPPPRACPCRLPRLLRSGRPPLGPAARRPHRGSRRAPFSLYQTSSGGGTGRRDDGAGRRVNRATDEEALAPREVRGPVTAQFGWPPAQPATHPPAAGGRATRVGARRLRPSPASPPWRRTSNFTLSAVSGDTGTASSGGPGAGASQLWGGAVADAAFGRRRRAAGLTFRRARAASAARPPTRVFCNQSVRLIKGGATAS